MICFDRSQGQDFSSLPNKQGRALDRRALSIEIESVSLAAQLRGLLIPSADIHSETEDLPAFETHNMAQKSLFKNKKNPAQKAVAANRHGKIAKTKKGTSHDKACRWYCARLLTEEAWRCLAGNLSAPPKKANLLKAYTDNKVAL